MAGPGVHVFSDKREKESQQDDNENFKGIFDAEVLDEFTEGLFVHSVLFFDAEGRNAASDSGKNRFRNQENHIGQQGDQVGISPA